MTDEDAQLLDAHLDDALSPIDAEHLRVRLAAEPDLTAALDRLRRERAVRLAVWRATEPSESRADVVARAAINRARGAERNRRFARVLGSVAAAAACFAAGWFGRAGVVSRGGAESNGVAAVTPGAGSVERPAVTAAPGMFRVALTDDSGNVLAVQTFSRLDEARRFAADLTTWQSQQQHSGTRQGQMVLISDEF